MLPCLDKSFPVTPEWRLETQQEPSRQRGGDIPKRLEGQFEKWRNEFTGCSELLNVGTNGLCGRSQRRIERVGRLARWLLGQLSHVALSCIHIQGRIVRGYRKPWKWEQYVSYLSITDLQTWRLHFGSWFDGFQPMVTWWYSASWWQLVSGKSITHSHGT